VITGKGPLCPVRLFLQVIGLDCDGGGTVDFCTSPRGRQHKRIPLAAH